MAQTKAQLIDPVDGSLVNADINASAAIAGSKISPDFGSQNIVTTGSITGNDLEIDSDLVEEAIKNYTNPIVKKYSGGHFFSSGMERKVAQEFIDNIKK